MYICIEGCAHGDLEKIYSVLAFQEKNTRKKIDLLICCGDFQAVRNKEDLACMAVPAKYLEMGSFYKYYSGELFAPILTIFIGGNHEASNHLQELSYGGWVAPNIYYLGNAGVINVNGVRIGGISGIYRDYLYSKGHFEVPPYDDSTVRSVYGIRNLEIFRLMQLTPSKIDIMLSHDWPQKIWEYGNKNERFGSVEGLLRLKPAFKADMDSGKLGSPPCLELLKQVKPHYWYSAHMHCRFDALIDHGDDEQTKFVALDKCLPGRNFFEFVEIGDPVERNEEGIAQIKLEYDAEWLSILLSTNKFFNGTSSNTRLPRKPLPNKSYDENLIRWNYTPTDEEIKAVRKKFNNDFTIEHDFKQTVEAFCPQWERVDPHNLKKPQPRSNIQTREFCEKLGIDDPLIVAANFKNIKVISIDYNNSNDDAFKDYTETDTDHHEIPKQKEKFSLKLPKPINDEEIDLDNLDDSSNDSDSKETSADKVQEEQRLLECEDKVQVKESDDEPNKTPKRKSESEDTEVKVETKAQPAIKKFKRRNHELYKEQDDE